MVGFFVFLLGSILGSFTSCLALRQTRGESILSPRSHCDSCQRTLAFIDLVPLVSFLGLRGRCRTCGAKIGLEFFLSELGLGLLFVLYYQALGLSFELVFYMVLLCLLLKVSLTDYWTKLVGDRDLALLILLALLRQGINFYQGDFYLSIAMVQIGLISLGLYSQTRARVWVGEADLFILASMASFFDLRGLVYLVGLSSWLALGPALVRKKRGHKDIYMVPFMALAFVLLDLLYLKISF